MAEPQAFNATSQSNRKPVDRSATRALYIVVVEDPLAIDETGIPAQGIQQYRADDIREHDHYLEILGGSILTHEQADKLRKNPKLKAPKAEVNVKLPWVTVKKIENVTYKKAR